jgi:hypothetical protein
MLLTPNAKRFYARSFADPTAQLFRDGDFWCCGVIGQHASLIKLLWEEGVLEGLSKLGLLVGTQPINADAGSDYQFVLSLCRPFRLSYCYEWCPEMWKAGALHLIDLLSALADLELTLQNPQPYYLLFDGARPVYINPGSIAHLTQRTFRRAVERLSQSFLYPLILSQAKKSQLARRLLRGVAQSIEAEGFAELERLAEKVTAWLETLTPIDCLRALRSEVEAIQLSDDESYWSNYYSDEIPLVPGEKWSRKQHDIYRVLTEHAPRTVLDIASNVGRYSRLAAASGAEVIAADFDETCVNRLYKRAREERAAILPLVMDINDPTPGFGIENGWFPPACERLQSDLVLALAVSHHLVFAGMRLNLDQLVRAFAPFAKRWLLVEFIPFDSEGMIYTPEDRPEAASWYNLESFVATLETHFSDVSVLPGEIHARRLVLCQR